MASFKCSFLCGENWIFGGREFNPHDPQTDFGSLHVILQETETSARRMRGADIMESCRPYVRQDISCS